MGPSGYARGFVVYVALAIMSLVLTGILRLALRRESLETPVTQKSAHSH